MLVWGIILSISLLLGFTRFGVRVRRAPDGRFRLILRAGFLRIDLMKWQERAKRKVKKDKPEKDKAQKEPKRTGKEMLEMLRGMAMPTFRSLRRGIRVDRMIFRFTVAGGNDPCNAAMLYGRLHIIWGVLRPVLNETLRIKKQRVELGLDFDLGKIGWDVDFAVSISLGRSLAVLLTALTAIMRQRKTIPGKAV